MILGSSGQEFEDDSESDTTGLPDSLSLGRPVNMVHQTIRTKISPAASASKSIKYMKASIR